MNKLRKCISTALITILLITVVFSGTPSIAASMGDFTDVPEGSIYSDALNRLVTAGILSPGEKFNPDSILTREQYAKMIVAATGNESTAEALMGTSIFSDIDKNRWSNGYINVAVNKGYITGWYDGTFNPTGAVTFAQICTFFVRALGYTDIDLKGEWPSNYIAKAAELGLTDGISLDSNSGIPRWAAILMFDRLLNSKMKYGSAASGQTFIESTGNYTRCIVFGDSGIIDTLTDDQVLTDKGTFRNSSGILLEPGSENYLLIKNGHIQKAFPSSSIVKISVDQAAENRVKYTNNGKEETLLLPEGIIYYYRGQKIDYQTVMSLLQKSSSIVLNYSPDQGTYSFAVIFAPVYSKPEIADQSTSTSNKAGSITFDSDSTVIKDNEIITVDMIEKNDVVYRVTDIWGGNGYIHVVDNKVAGKVTAILPNRLSPKTIQINGSNYTVSQDIDLKKVNNPYSGLDVDKNIVVYLGYDGKIVNIEGFGTQAGSEYAVVLGAGFARTTDINGGRKTTYTAKLLFAEGYIATYNVTENAAGMKGQLVKYKFVDSITVDLEQESYNFPGEMLINKEERLLGDSYVSDNVIIFNVMFNDPALETTAAILKWSEMPAGKVPSGKIWYVGTTGPFDDVHVIMADDILNQRYKTGMIKSVGIIPAQTGITSSYTVLIEGKEYSFSNNTSDILPGTVFKFKMDSRGIESISGNAFISASASTIEAIDSRRIKLNGKVYYLSKNVSLCYRDANGKITAKSLLEIDTAKTYHDVELYSTNMNGTNSIVDLIYIKE